jgi:hypothetical protein
MYSAIRFLQILLAATHAGLPVARLATAGQRRYQIAILGDTRSNRQYFIWMERYATCIATGPAAAGQPWGHVPHGAF